MGILSEPIERASADDLMSLAGDRDSSPLHVCAIVKLGAGHADAASLECLLAARFAAVPRLNQRLETVPWGCGRPIWVTDQDFDIARHLRVVIGDPDATALAMVSTPLPHDRPLWAAQIVIDTDDRAFLVIVFHHVLADGIGALAMLSALSDERSESSATPLGRGRPSNRVLRTEAAVTRWRSVRHPVRGMVRAIAAIGQLRPTMLGRLPPTSFLRPPSDTKRFLTVSASREQLHRHAHGRGATINDAILAAVVGAMRELAAHRGETLDRLVVSVPFSSRITASTRDLGNHSGVIPLGLPTRGSSDERLLAIATITTEAKRSVAGASSALLGPLFRTLARLGIFERFIDGQRTIHTIVSNVRGPEHELHLGGQSIQSITPLSAATGNVSVSFLALSYADTLSVTIVADAVHCPDVELLQDLLAEELDALSS